MPFFVRCPVISFKQCGVFGMVLLELPVFASRGDPPFVLTHARLLFRSEPFPLLSRSPHVIEPALDHWLSSRIGEHLLFFLCDQGRGP